MQKITQACDEFGRLFDIIDNGDGTYRLPMMTFQLYGPEFIYISGGMVEYLMDLGD